MANENIDIETFIYEIESKINHKEYFTSRRIIIATLSFIKLRWSKILYLLLKEGEPSEKLYLKEILETLKYIKRSGKLAHYILNSEQRLEYFKDYDIDKWIDIARIETERTKKRLSWRNRRNLGKRKFGDRTWLG